MNRTQIHDTGALIGATIEAVIEAISGDEILLAVSGGFFVVLEAETYERDEASICLKQRFWHYHFGADDLRKVFDAATCDAWEAEVAAKQANEAAQEELDERKLLERLIEKYKAGQ